MCKMIIEVSGKQRSQGSVNFNMETYQILKCQNYLEENLDLTKNILSEETGIVFSLF